jgi:prepilin-type N-terminal cleavage/methylation domain-containing protein
MRKEGFTLIELMIVIAIIAIIAAIAIPGMLGGRLTANETSAVGSLRTLTSQEAVWRQGDLDGNGIKDYWTYDLSCFNRMTRADGITKVACIDTSFARADNLRAVDGVFGATPVVEAWDAGGTALAKVAKSGYWFERLTTPFIGSLVVYQSPSNLVGLNAIPACNGSIFGFVAAPEAWGASGINMFCVNEGGSIYSTDPGADITVGGTVTNWNMTVGANPLTWPATTAGGSPTSSLGPGGRNWGTSE